MHASTFHKFGYLGDSSPVASDQPASVAEQHGVHGRPVQHGNIALISLCRLLKLGNMHDCYLDLPRSSLYHDRLKDKCQVSTRLTISCWLEAGLKHESASSMLKNR